METAEALFSDYLRKRNLKLTPERRTILREVLGHRGHVDADEILVHLRSKDERVSRATIYRTLDLLVDSGLIWKVSLGTTQAHYEHAYGAKHHDHLICLSCRQVIEFVNDRIEQLQVKVCRDHGFTAVRHNMQIFGYCSKCGKPE
ncbi:MAG: transcriptional repressor [Acidobacteriota bacterium]